MTSTVRPGSSTQAFLQPDPAGRRSVVHPERVLHTLKTDVDVSALAPADLETITALRCDTVDVTVPRRVVERHHAEIAFASKQHDGRPALSPLGLLLQEITNHRAPPSNSTVLSPEDRSALVNSFSAIDLADVTADAHVAVLAAGRAFMAAMGNAGTTLADFVALRTSLLDTSIFTKEEAIAAVEITSSTATVAAKNTLADVVQIANGSGFSQLRSFQSRAFSGNYDAGQVNGLFTSSSTMLHEYGHHILATSPPVLHAAIALLCAREGIPLSSPDEAMKQIAELGASAASDYTYQRIVQTSGKDISSRPAINNTELLPVALQHFATPAAMQHLHDNDPDLFFFALGVVRPG